VKEVKRLEQEVKQADALVWAKESYNIAMQANLGKFSDPRNENLKWALLSTKTKTIIKAIQWGNLWRVGFNKEEAIRKLPTAAYSFGVNRLV
jgi:predicted NAD-dependent protein-ADP-ribosyltransferase YbiA (DUF1768 family)